MAETMRDQDDFGPTWFLLRPLPDPGGVPASVRMRRALKCLLRSFGIKNEGMRTELPATTIKQNEALPLD